MAARHDAKLAAAIGKAGMLTPAYVCPWCGTRNHSVWVGDHVVPLGRAAGSPIVSAGKGCNTSRRGVRASSAQMARLFRPVVPIATHAGEEIRRFCAEWAESRYGSAGFLDLAIGDSGPLVPIQRRDMHSKKIKCPSGQRIADKAYISADGHTPDTLAAKREDYNRGRMAKLRQRGR